MVLSPLDEEKALKLKPSCLLEELTTSLKR